MPWTPLATCALPQLLQNCDRSWDMQRFSETRSDRCANHGSTQRKAPEGPTGHTLHIDRRQGDLRYLQDQLTFAACPRVAQLSGCLHRGH